MISMYVHIEHGEQSIWVAVFPVCFDSGADGGLGEDEISEVV